MLPLSSSCSTPDVITPGLVLGSHVLLALFTVPRCSFPATGQAAEADKLLAGFSPSSSSSSSAEEAARPTLLRAQLALEAGNAAAALQLLGSGLPAELQMRPAVLATRVALHEQVRHLQQLARLPSG